MLRTAHTEHNPTLGRPGQLSYTASSLEASHHRTLFAAVEASRSAVSRAKRTADESLRRAQEAPEPHGTTNSIFVAMWEIHQGDREALFAAMRRLDEACDALRSGAPNVLREENRPPSTE